VCASAIPTKPVAVGTGRGTQVRRRPFNRERYARRGSPISEPLASVPAAKAGAESRRRRGRGRQRTGQRLTLTVGFRRVVVGTVRHER